MCAMAAVSQPSIWGVDVKTVLSYVNSSLPRLLTARLPRPPRVPASPAFSAAARWDRNGLLALYRGVVSFKHVCNFENET